MIDISLLKHARCMEGSHAGMELAISIRLAEMERSVKQLLTAKHRWRPDLGTSFCHDGALNWMCDASVSKLHQEDHSQTHHPTDHGFDRVVEQASQDDQRCNLSIIRP